MTMEAQDFTIWQGEDKVIDVIVYEPNGVERKNLTGATITWIVKKKVNTDVAKITKTNNSGITITSPTQGEFSIVLADTDSATLIGKYYHEAKINIGGNIDVIFVGEFTVKESGFTSLPA